MPLGFLVSIDGWRKFDKFALMNKRIRIETMEEKDKLNP